MADTFPELGVTASDCIEMMWIQSMLYFAFYGTGKPLEMLLDRGTSKLDKYLKAKSDSIRPRTCPAKSGRPPGAGSSRTVPGCSSSTPTAARWSTSRQR
uniref:Uncharacterized protein n=1 Tax=Oryza barthii TaxID=65489 RepID=A0A0D3GUL9_9ORYZ